MTDELLACPRCLSPARGGAYRASEDARRRPELTPTTWEADIHVMECASCQGVWLAEGQLDAIRQTRGNDYSKLDKLAAIEAHTRHAASTEDDARELGCPSCNSPMVKNPYRATRVMIHTCTRCAGSFVDAHELVQLELHAELFHSR